MTIIYVIDFAAIARAHADHERRRAYTRQWRRNRERVGMGSIQSSPLSVA